jgi:hypothetical protein
MCNESIYLNGRLNYYFYKDYIKGNQVIFYCVFSTKDEFENFIYLKVE